MKFESKFGVGEICIVNEKTYEKPFSNRERYFGERLVKIMSVIFSAGDPNPRYLVEIPLKDGGVQHAYANEGELTGDPEFDQDEGRYPPDEDQISDAEWDEERIDAIGQNGNGGEHYGEPPRNDRHRGHNIVEQGDLTGRCTLCGQVFNIGDKIVIACKGKQEVGK